MLPDFLGMVGIGRKELGNKQAALGVENHLEADRLFHQLPEFRTLERWAIADLGARGFRRGPARGLAHVGVELSLDGWLIKDRCWVERFRSALEVDPGISWAGDEALRYDTLIGRLRQSAPDYGEPSRVSRHLIRALAERPLLALNDGEIERLGPAIECMHHRVGGEGTELMRALRRAFAQS